MTKVKVLKVGQTSMSRSLGRKLWYDVKGLVTRNAMDDENNNNDTADNAGAMTIDWIVLRNFITVNLKARTMRDSAFIFHMWIACDKSFDIIP